MCKALIFVYHLVAQGEFQNFGKEKCSHQADKFIQVFKGDIASKTQVILRVILPDLKHCVPKLL